jgi:DNA-directed RNA polymerase specialized sigma24 family protein
MSPQVGYLLQDQVVPRLQAVIPRSVLCIGSKDHEELIADATLQAARIMHNAEAKGKTITASNAAYYAIQHCKSGRRSVGHSSVDAHGSACQLQGHSKLESMEQVVAVDEITGAEVLLHEVLSDDAEDPSTKAARKMDWEDFMSGLSARDQGVVALLVEGRSTSTMARKLKVCSSTIHHRKKSLAKSILEFMGDSILIDIQRRPNWKNNLTATKERLACKYDRAH